MSDWTEETARRAEDWTVDTGVLRNDVERCLEVIQAADRLAALVAAYQRDVVEDPDGSLWVQRMAEIDAALAAYQKVRQG